jgi:hypothetical protein
MSWITVTLYGCDITTTGETPDLASVTGLSGVTSAVLGVKSVHGKPIVDLQDIVYTDKSKRTITKIRYAFEPETSFKAFPTTATSIDTYFGSDVLSKRYLWLDLTNYKISHKGYSAGKVLAVNYTGIEVTENDERGGKFIKYTFESRD